MDRAGSSQSKRTREELKEREQEATSREGLKDVAEKEKNAGTPPKSSDKPPSPDGAFDENRELKDADPI